MTSFSTVLPSLDLIRRSIEIEAAYTLSRMRVLEGIPGNPVGIAHRRIGESANAFMARHLPSPHFNSVVGLRAGEGEHIPELVEWYRGAGVKGRFELVPGNCDAELARLLARHGYYQSGFHISTIGDPDLAQRETSGVTVERVTSADLMEEYLKPYAAGWGIPEPHRAQFKSNVRPWLGQPGWSLYIGRIGGRAGAAATLFIAGGAGYLADAATDPALRGRGLQLALLRRRVADAKAAGVDFVCSGAEFLSASHRNMARIGMRLQFVRAVWTPL